jgi:phage FluMu protein Com
MIEISLPAALVVYSTIIVVGALAIWVYTEITSRRAYLVLEKQYLWRCVFCSYVYLDQDAIKHSRCPQCHAINSLEDKNARYIPASRRALADQAPLVRQESRRNPSRGKRPGASRRGPRRRGR